MASQTEIVNRALFKLGGAPITALTDNTTAARVMSGIWDSVRKAELMRRYWNFALNRASLPALATTPEWGYYYAYQLPPDFLKIAQVNDVWFVPSLQDYRNFDDSPYAIEGTTIATNFTAPLNIRYVMDVTDPSLFDPLFVEALASKLAYEACYAITQSLQGRDQMGADYKQAILEAGRANAVAKPPQGIPDDAWIMSRL